MDYSVYDFAIFSSLISKFPNPNHRRVL